MVERISRGGDTLVAALVLALALGSAGSVRAAVDDAALAARYVEAARLVRDGAPDRALSVLEKLAGERRDSVAVHRAIALLALETGTADAWRKTLRGRVRRSARDVGASVGLAILERERGRRSEAHRLLLTVLGADGRDPLLAPLLLETTNNPAGLLSWMKRRQAVLPHDPDFAALRARMLLARGRVSEARSVVDKALARDPEHPDLLLLSARIAAAAGTPRRACEAARVAAGFLAGRAEVPELRVPRRTALARVFAGCGALEEAQALLASTGPRIGIGVGRDLERSYLLARAELRLAAKRPLEALALLGTADGTGDHEATLDEWGWSIRARALALAAIPAPSLFETITGPPPSGLPLASRMVALAALAGAPETTDGGEGQAALLARRIAGIAAELAKAGLAPRSLRASMLAWKLGGPPPGRGTESPELTVGRALIAAEAALDEGRAQAASEAAAVGPLAMVGAPRVLTARLRLLGARAALATGRASDAMTLARDGLLDLEEADRVGMETPWELRPLAGPADELALALAGTEFRAALGTGIPLPDAASQLLRRLARIVRRWSVLETAWRHDPRQIADDLPAGSCLVVSTGEPDVPVLAIGPGGDLAAGGWPDLLAEPTCAGSGPVWWLGPAAAPEGLVVGSTSPRILVRAVQPEPVRRRRVPASEGADAASIDREVPFGGFASLVRSAALERSVESNLPASGTDVLAVGPGLALARAPMASGLLATPRGAARAMWIGPEELIAGGLPGSGCLVVPGMRRLPGRTRIDEGSWVLAEGALLSGRHLLLVSTRPLTAAEMERLEPLAESFCYRPLGTARGLAESDAALAGALSLWSAPGELPPEREGRWWIPLLAGLTAVVAAAGIALAWRRSKAR